MRTRLDVSAEVRSALESGKPVVALESTIISHGFPYPANVECAVTAEQVAREHGAVPATIAIIGGVVRVGLGRDDIEHLATAPGIAKASRRDIATLVARGSDGATTVAGTMLIASLAGIRVFATGGIGGVHRGGAESMDISADLTELASTPVTVVCAGAKSVLDLRLTLEYLETHGVPVLGYRTDEFPAFYTRTSGLGVDARVETPQEVAEIMRVREELGVAGGMVVANPIPREHEIPHEEIDGVIDRALAEAAKSGVRGKDVTPFLLARIHALTSGRSETANKELVYHNVELASQIASAMCDAPR
ncbi:MAG: pseudouridine-5'-phosphate glycosidase [Actinomycetia bacterium]|nr:pseudouridine-5'-phosphate glycosidase [Actinomycetes bacterium]